MEDGSFAAYDEIHERTRRSKDEVTVDRNYKRGE